MQSQDHRWLVAQPELRQNKGEGRPYTREHWVDAIKIRGCSDLVGLPQEIKGVSTRNQILRIHLYGNTEWSDPADETYVLSSIARPKRRLLPHEFTTGLQFAGVSPRASMLGTFVCSSVPIPLSDMARGIKCGG